MKTTKKLLLTLAIAFSFIGLGITITAPDTHAEDICSRLTPGTDVYNANGCGGSSTADFSNVLVGILNGLVVVFGVIAAIFIVVGGVNYMTSAGDSGKVQKAKNTILYAVIGLVISALAFAIVNFVITNVIESNGGGSNNNSSNTSSDSGSEIGRAHV